MEAINPREVLEELQIATKSKLDLLFYNVLEIVANSELNMLDNLTM